MESDLFEELFAELDQDFENGYLEDDESDYQRHSSDEELAEHSLTTQLSNVQQRTAGLDIAEGVQNENVSNVDNIDTALPISPARSRRFSSQSDVIHLVNYDPNLAGQHTYLGSDLEEIACSKLQDEGSVVTLPLLTIDSVVLVPGQTIPLRIQHPLYVTILQSIAKSTRLFGLFNNIDISMQQFFGNKSIGIGTTAEIRNYAEHDTNRGTCLRMKVVGRQRFQVRKTWVDESGVLMGSVLILPELHDHSHCALRQNVFGRAYGDREKKLRNVCTSVPGFVYDLYDSNILMQQLAERLRCWTRKKRSFDSASSTERHARRENDDDDDNETDLTNVEVYATRQTNDDRIGQPIRPALWSSGSGDAQVTRTVVTRIRDEASTSDSRRAAEDSDEDETDYCAPSEPAPFSYWIISNLPIQDFYRIQALSLDSAVQRLRLEVSIMNLCSQIYCKHCQTCFCRREDVFAMSTSGPQASYVNERGTVMDLFTVYEAKCLKATTNPSVHFTWFPGYAWILAKCSNCDTQVGFKFVAVDKSLKPESFWGLFRSSVNSWSHTDQTNLVF